MGDNTGTELETLRLNYEQQLRRLHCPLPVIAHGHISGDTVFGGNGINITCHAGYELAVGEPRQASHANQCITNTYMY